MKSTGKRLNGGRDALRSRGSRSTKRSVFSMLFRTLLLSAVLAVATAAPALSQDTPKPGRFEIGSRAGPFVATEKSLSALTGDGYEIRGNLGTALILQKSASVYSCQIPPDPESLGFKPYFVCAELQELPRDATAEKETNPAPQTKN